MKKISLFFIGIAWVTLVILHGVSSDISFSVLKNRYGIASVAVTDDKITGEFVAKEDNFGIIGVRLATRDITKVDKVRFSLKEKNAADWYYGNDYRITSLPNTRLFPFGFPIIRNSAGKVFQFEITRREGETRILNTFPAFNAYYKFYKKDLLRQPRDFGLFLVKKTISYFSNLGSLLRLSAYLLVPILVHRLLIGKERALPLVLVLGLIFYDVFFDYRISETVVVALTAAAVFSLWYLRARSKISYALGVAFWIATAVLFFTGREQMIQKAGIWGFVFLSVALAQDAFGSLRSGSGRTSAAGARIRRRKRR